MCNPRSSKRNPEPATRSFTVPDTNVSPGPAIAATRAAMLTAMPPISSPLRSVSPLWRAPRRALLTRGLVGVGRAWDTGGEQSTAGDRLYRIVGAMGYWRGHANGLKQVTHVKLQAQAHESNGRGGTTALTLKAGPTTDIGIF